MYYDIYIRLHRNLYTRKMHFFSLTISDARYLTFSLSFVSPSTIFFFNAISYVRASDNEDLLNQIKELYIFI